MAIKKLSGISIAELRLEEKFEGKIWAYAPTITGDIPSLGIVVANEKGYCPISAFFVYADTYDEMAAHADELNQARGLDSHTAFRIIASTMGGKRFVAGGETESHKLQAAMDDTSGPIRLIASPKGDDLLPSNEDRAERIAQVYEMYQANTGVDDQESFVADLLADVMHFCQREDIDFEEKTGTAKMHFEDECEDEKNLSDAPRG